MDNNLNSQSELNIDMSFATIIKNSITIGVKNFLPLLINTILWILTIWIPYINIGTTIGMLMIVLSLSKGKSISETEIFNIEYRKRMGEYFILMGLKTSAITFGIFLLFLPAIVVKLAFSQAAYLMFDKGMNPIESITISNKITNGYKWRMFFAPLIVNSVIGFAASIITILLYSLAFEINSTFFSLIFILFIIFLLLLFVPVNLGSSAYIYSQLSKRC